MERSFTDSDGEVVSFQGSSTSQKTVTRDFGTSTTHIPSVTKETQATERKDVEIQSDRQNVDTKLEYDEGALLDFMRRFAPKVEAELRKRNRHFGVNFQQSQSDENDYVARKVGTLPPCGKVGEIRSKQVCWSCYGNKIAISFGYMKHEIWCKHSAFVLIYESDKNEEFVNEAKECIEVNSCIVDMKFHPTMNSILVFATEEGKLYWHNTTDSKENNSQNYIQCKSLRITQLLWVELDSSFYLAVADLEGFLNLWNTSAHIKDWNIWRRFTFKSPGISNDHAVVCFDFSINPQHFVVAMEGGRLLQCSLTLSSLVDDQTYNPVVDDLVCPSLIIDKIAFSKFDESTFVVSTSDQYLKIYHLNEKMPIFSIALEQNILGLEWSYSQDNILITWFPDGTIKYYDYRECRVLKSSQTKNAIESLSFKIRGMKLLYLAVSTDNLATIWETGLFVK